ARERVDSAKPQPLARQDLYAGCYKKDFCSPPFLSQQPPVSHRPVRPSGRVRSMVWQFVRSMEPSNSHDVNLPVDRLESKSARSRSLSSSSQEGSSSVEGPR